MNIFAKEKKQIILRREDLVKNTGLLSKELSKLFFGNTHFFEHYLSDDLVALITLSNPPNTILVSMPIKTFLLIEKSIPWLS